MMIIIIMEDDGDDDNDDDDDDDDEDDEVGLRMQLSGDCVKVIARHSPLTIALSCLLTLQIKDDGDGDDDGDHRPIVLVNTSDQK